MPKLPHNQRAIDGLRPSLGKRVSYTSDAMPGLMLEVFPSGVKTWRVWYRTSGGRKGECRTYTIGDATLIKLGAALDKAPGILSAVKLEGQDPQSERRSTGNSFEALFGDWLDRHAKPVNRRACVDGARIARKI